MTMTRAEALNLAATHLHRASELANSVDDEGGPAAIALFMDGARTHATIARSAVLLHNALPVEPVPPPDSSWLHPVPNLDDTPGRWT